MAKFNTESSTDSNMDDELAHMTDKLLAGQDAELTLDNTTQARIVAHLYAAVTTGHGPEAAFRSELTQRLNEEWDHVFSRKSARWIDRRPVRFGALAAIMVVVLGVTLAALSNGASGPLIGTVLGGNAPAILGILVIGAAIVAVLTFWRRH